MTFLSFKLTVVTIAFTKGINEIFLDFVFTESKSVAPLLETPTTKPSLLSSLSTTSRPTSSSIKNSSSSKDSRIVTSSTKSNELQMFYET